LGRVGGRRVEWAGRMASFLYAGGDRS